MDFIDRMRWRNRRRVVFIVAGGAFIVFGMRRIRKEGGSLLPRFSWPKAAVAAARRGLRDPSYLWRKPEPPAPSRAPLALAPPERPQVTGSPHPQTEPSRVWIAPSRVPAAPARAEPAAPRPREDFVQAKNFIKYESPREAPSFNRGFLEGLYRKFDFPFRRRKEANERRQSRGPKEIAGASEVDLTRPAAKELSKAIAVAPSAREDTVLVQLREKETEMDGEAVRARRLKEEGIARWERRRYLMARLQIAAVGAGILLVLALILSGLIRAMRKVLGYSQRDG